LSERKSLWKKLIKKVPAAMKMIYIFATIVLTIVLISPSQSIMQFSYKCDGKGATATTYSYTREPRLQETGYEAGLKTGSFNYLEKGDMKIEENIDYFYGNGTNMSNSSIDHSLYVNFTGKRGISEFFGKGFFGNNRYASAWKKIKYEYSPNMKVDGHNMVARPSNSIVVDASVFMDTTDNRSAYDFNYNAKIENGVIETKDSTGWTNMSGSRRTDWEHETRSIGDKLDITNKLYDSWGLKTRFGPEGDWLPCCYSGTMPAITMRHDVDYPWPSDVTIATLEANRVLPTRSLSTAYSIPSNDSPAYWKREIQIGLSSKPSVPVYNAEVSAIGLRKAAQPSQGGIVVLNANQLLPTMHLSAAYAPSISYPVYWKREAQVGLRSLVPAVVPVQMTANSSPSVQSQEKTDSSLFASVPVQNPANCIGDNCPANFFVSKNQSNFSCNDGVCEGYDCIYTYDEDAASSTITTAAFLKGDIRNIKITHFYVNETIGVAKREFGSDSYDAREEKYLVNVTNNGDVPLTDVQIEAVLPKGMRFATSEYYGSGSGKLATPIQDPPVSSDFDETVKTTVTWDIGSLQPAELKSILFKTYIKEKDKHDSPLNVDNTDVSVKAVGNAQGNLLVRSSVDRAIPKKCEPRLKFGRLPPNSAGQISGPFKEKLEKKTELYCEEWTEQAI